MARAALHDLLCEVLGAPFPDGEDHCYFEPPSKTQMKYPCLKYDYSNDLDTFADNIHYQSSKRYGVTIIDYNPDSKIPDRLKKKFNYCSFDRSFVVDGLHHFVYALYYNGPRIKEESEYET